MSKRDQNTAEIRAYHPVHMGNSTPSVGKFTQLWCPLAAK